MKPGNRFTTADPAMVAFILLIPILCGCAATHSGELRDQRPATSPPPMHQVVQPSPVRQIPSVPPVPSGSAIVAIVIDDCGESAEQVIPFLGIPIALSFGVLPWHSESSRTSMLIASRGFETLAHMPMEPHDSRWLENDWFLKTGMDSNQISTLIDKALEAVPTATGMNNHMGSKFTADGTGMDHVMSRLRDRDIYFLDSRTSDASAATAACSRQNARCLSRDVFIDNDDDVDAISIQLKKLIETARKNGCAVGIGHCRSRTAAAIMNYVRARDPGVAFVPAGRIFEHCPSAQSQNRQE